MFQIHPTTRLRLGFRTVSVGSFAFLVLLFILGGVLSGPAANQALAYRFVAMGDSRGNDASNFVNKEVLGYANQSVASLDPAPSFLIFFGDNSVLGDLDVNGQHTFTYQDWYNFMRTPPTGLPTQLPMYLVVGNHELYQASLGDEVMSFASQTGYQNFVSANRLLTPDTLMPGAKSLPGYDNLSYSFTTPDQKSLFVVLDGFYVPSSKNTPYVDAGVLDDTQLKYLNDTLANSQATTKFVISHNPAFTPTNQNYATAVDESMGQFWQIVDNNDVSAVLNGHVHMYSRVMVDSSFTSGIPNPNPGLNFQHSIPQIIAGSVGAPLIGSVSNEPSTIYTPASWNWKNLYNYSVIDVDNSSPAGKVTVNSYCSDGTSPWTLCDSYSSDVPTSMNAVDAFALSTKNVQPVPTTVNGTMQNSTKKSTPTGIVQDVQGQIAGDLIQQNEGFSFLSALGLNQ